MPQIQQEGKSFVTPDSVHLTLLSVPPRHLSVGGTHPLHHVTLQSQVTPLDRRREYPQHLSLVPSLHEGSFQCSKLLDRQTLTAELTLLQRARTFLGA